MFKIAFFTALLLSVFYFAPAQIQVKKTADGLLLLEKTDSVLFYRIKPLSLNGKYERCNYIHPLWGADGTVLTEDFPEDHLHHRGIFWAWHQLNIAGKNICDGWELKDFLQVVTNSGAEVNKSGCAVLKVSVDWKSPNWKVNGQIVPFIKETSIITIYPQTGNYRQIDFEISLLATTENLSIGGSADVKGYSGFSVRMKLPADVVFSGINGMVTPENTAVQSPGFIDVSGSILREGKKGGIVITDYSENPGYPQPWILRARNSMQNAAFPGNQLYPVSDKKPLVLKYSLLVYSGQMNSAEIKSAVR